jgi:hypothetical protein
MIQQEMVDWLYINRCIQVHQTTVSRLIARKGWSRGKLYAISKAQDPKLREFYRQEMRKYDPEGLSFLMSLYSTREPVLGLEATRQLDMKQDITPILDEVIRGVYLLQCRSMAICLVHRTAKVSYTVGLVRLLGANVIYRILQQGGVY